MHCRYCDIAYALADPNCRGCGAPKSADGVRRGMDAEMQSRRNGLLSHDADEHDTGFLSYIERLQRLSPIGIGAVVVTILGLVMILGPGGLIMLAILFPKMMVAKSEYNVAKLKERDQRRASSGPFDIVKDSRGLEP